MVGVWGAQHSSLFRIISYSLTTALVFVVVLSSGLRLVHRICIGFVIVRLGPVWRAAGHMHATATRDARVGHASDTVCLYPPGGLFVVRGRLGAPVGWSGWGWGGWGWGGLACSQQAPAVGDFGGGTEPSAGDRGGAGVYRVGRRRQWRGAAVRVGKQVVWWVVPAKVFGVAVGRREDPTNASFAQACFRRARIGNDTPRLSVGPPWRVLVRARYRASQAGVGGLGLFSSALKRAKSARTERAEKFHSRDCATGI